MRQFTQGTQSLGILAILILAFIFVSACDTVLDRSPEDSLTPETFFQSERELETYINSLYAYLPGAGIFNGDFASDNVVQKTPNRVAAGQHTVPGAGGGWSWGFLREVNFFLDNYDNGGLSLDRAAPSVGVARFFRAWFYFDKVKRFGQVPWYSRPLSPDDEDLFKPRDSRDLVMDSVLTDLNFAVENVPVEAPFGRIDRGAALALKARVSLHEGTFRKYHNLGGSERWLQEARDAAQLIIETENFDLYSTGNPQQDYRDLFVLEQANPDEVILATIYNRSLNKTHTANYTFISTTFGSPGLTKAAVNTYLNEDGTSFSTRPGADTLSFYSETQGRDPRLAQTIRTPGYTRIGESEPLIPNFDNAQSGYHNTKFVMSTGFDQFNTNVNDLPVFRLGEMLLIYAEARAELGELTQADLDASVNRLRDRAGMPPLILGNYPNQDILRDRYPNVGGAQAEALLEIRRERRVELMMEGFRYDDLMRWKVGPLMAKRSNGIYFSALGLHDLDRDGNPDVALVNGDPADRQSGVQYLDVSSVFGLSEGNTGYLVPHPNLEKTFDDPKHYYFPIPINQLTLNDNLEQNPGW
jgi:starch-binding outer membrane protein, SusD/RagB family